MRGRRSALALALAVCALAGWRAACILAGPDIDTDAYAHHMIARAILADPGDLAVHWVWLPLFHYLQVPFVALGGTMNGVRWANLGLAAALPVVLFEYVRRTVGVASSRPAAATWTALVAALFAAACPIAMQMGTTAQPEPLFALVMLGVAIAYERGVAGLTALLLGAAVLLRYEAWASLATVAAIEIAERLGRSSLAPPFVSRLLHHLRRRTGAASPHAWLAVAVPVALILAWAALRRPVDGQWFGFVRQTHEFASQVAASQGAGQGSRAVAVVRDSLYYPVFVAWRVMGPALPGAARGVARTVREQGARFVLVLASVLGFISLTWVMRSTLGLDRHFVAVVALYATFAAQGIAVVAEQVARVARSRGGDRGGELAYRVSAGVLSTGALGVTCVMLAVWMGFWRGSIERGCPERAALGEALRSLPARPTIFCDDATMEILSGLDRRRFDRHWIDDQATWDLVDQEARARGGVYVATWRRKLTAHEDEGDVVFRAGTSAADPLAGIEVLHVGPDGGRAAR